VRAELINLPFSSIFRRRLDPPLFLLQLAPKLESQGLKLRVNDLNGIDRSQWCFGHCIMYFMYIDFHNFNVAHRVATICREINENALIIATGSGPSKEITSYINDPLFDIIIRGEPEEAVKLMLNDTLGRKREIQKVYKADVNNLNTLPLPSRYLVDINSYNRRLNNEKAIMVLTSRGSPYRQTWLCKGLKTFGITRLMNEVHGIASMYGIRNFYFGDETFCFDRQRSLDIARAMNEDKFSFGFNDIIANVNLDFFKQLATFGCKEVTLNAHGSSGPEYVESMRAKIEEETGIRVILRHESKYLIHGGK